MGWVIIEWSKTGGTHHNRVKSNMRVMHIVVDYLWSTSMRRYLREEEIYVLKNVPLIPNVSPLIFVIRKNKRHSAT